MHLNFKFAYGANKLFNIVLFHDECIVRGTRVVTCNEFPKKLTVAQAADRQTTSFIENSKEAGILLRIEWSLRSALTTWITLDT